MREIGKQFIFSVRHVILSLNHVRCGRGIGKDILLLQSQLRRSKNRDGFELCHC
ncbi:hypothetical protein OG21DRAFT_1513901 [Imleria badia]|nr:hypothetical protein OG21DRAFT_1513901 [Imleria badia]